VTDLAPLVNNVDFGTDARLDLTGTTLDCSAQAVNLSALKTRGVTVQSGCP
jgi:hypothetical protein